jgi:raffinose/stachyose/melibiose transport system permease protein
MKSHRSAYDSVPKALAYLLPGLAVYALFVLVPVARTFALSLFEWDGLSPRAFVGAQNYAELLRDGRFYGSLSHNFILVFYLMVLPGSIGLFLATIVSMKGLRGGKAFEIVFFAPQILSMVVVSVIWKWIYNPGTGLIVSMLHAAGLDSLARPWLGDSHYALGAIGLTGTWVNFGFAFVVFLSGFKRIPDSLYESAEIDGAGDWRKFASIGLPLLKKEFGLVATFLFISSLKVFDLSYVMTRGGPGNSTDVLSLYVFKNAFQFNRIGYASALAVALALIIFALSNVLSLLTRKGEDYEIV